MKYKNVRVSNYKNYTANSHVGDIFSWTVTKTRNSNIIVLVIPQNGQSTLTNNCKTRRYLTLVKTNYDFLEVENYILNWQTSCGVLCD